MDKKRLKTKLKNFSINELQLKSKVFIYFMAVLLILLIILFLFQVLFIEPIYEYFKITQVKTCAKTIEEMIIKGEDYESEVLKLASSNASYIEITDSNGKRIIIEDFLTSCLLHDFSLIDYQSYFKEASKIDGEIFTSFRTNISGNVLAESIEITNKDDDPVLLKETFISQDLLVNKGSLKKEDAEGYIKSLMLSKKIRLDNGDEFFLFITTTLSPRGATVLAIRQEFIVVSLIMVIVTILLASLFSRRIYKPIEETTESAKKLATGDYSIEFTSYGYKEINELSEYLNYTTEELGRVEEMRKELVANVSHDLRAPLTLIKGYAELIRDFPEENPTDSIQIIIDETKRLSGLITEILDVSALGSGVMELDIKPFDITYCINAITSRMQRFLKKEGYTVTFKYDKRVKAFADEKRIQQVFYNILINAVNFTGEDKHIEVRQEIEKDFVRIEVIDTGIGMDPEQAKHIWQRNYSGDKMKKRLSSGTGIGLFLVKSVAELLGGTCGTHSNAGKGTVMWFTVKLAKDTEKN